MPEAYFQELQEWSERKHELLKKYLEGFVKILGSSSQKVYYVDGFAGPGLYGDGKKGSPLLAAEYAQALADKPYQLRCVNIEMDEDGYANLVRNTSPYSHLITNLHGAFSDQIDAIFQKIGQQPTIFFLDPFGIKGIEWRHLSRILARQDVTELLLRINPVDLQRLAGFANSTDGGAARKRQLLNELYGCAESRQWEQVYLARGAEGMVQLYTQCLLDGLSMSGKRMAYACRYPIRTIEGDTKYYLIFATRHSKGAVLMNDVIYAVEENYQRDVKDYKDRQTHQKSLFDSDPTPDEVFAEQVEKLQESIWQAFQGKRVAYYQIRQEMLSLWFGRVKGRHFTEAIKRLQADRRIVEVSGPASRDDTLIRFADPQPNFN